MFDSKSPVVKIAGYAIIGFFLLIIIISFGMPNIMPQGGDRTTVAVVNGKKINIADFARYRDNLMRQYPHLRNANMNDYILDDYLRKEVFYQKAKETGFEVSETRIDSVIRSEFRDRETGKYSPDLLKVYMERSFLSLNKLGEMIREQIIMNDFNQSISMGTAVPEQDIRTEYMIQNSRLQIQYAYLSAQDIRKEYQERITVTDQEISDELKKNAGDLKDPKTDRQRMKDKLEKKKMEAVEDELMEKINALAARGGSFASANGLLRGKTGISETFKIGDALKEPGKEGKPLTFLENSPVFREACLTLKPGMASSAIKTPMGLYIFTPTVQNISRKEPDEKEKKALAQKMQYEQFNASFSAIMQNAIEDSKIVKNLKTD
jgi:hypothetical protein